MIYLIIFFMFLILPLEINAKPIELNLNWKAEPQFGGFYAAKKEKLFEKYSLDVEIQQGGAGTPTIQIVAAGKVDFGVETGEQILISRSFGTDVIALFAVYQICPRVMMSHAERHFKTIKDIFEAPGSIATMTGIAFFTYFTQKYGKPKSQVVPYMGGITNFMNDPLYSQQAYLNSEPIIAANKGINVNTFLVSDEGYNPYSTVLITRKSLLEKNPKLVKNMVMAVREGWESYLKNPKETNALIHSLNGSIDEKTLQESADIQRDLIKPADSKNVLGNMTIERWKLLAEQLKSIKLIKSIPEIKDIFRNF